jgi:glycosyltransferase involved in cell wall biosynthesis
LSHEELSKIFEKSRIYIGCSISDGISTSFLEALARGVYPIQTNTSCANEWIEKGAIGSIISLNEIELENALKAAIEDDALVSKAAIANLSVIESHAKVSHIQKASLNFYGIRS